MVPRPDWSSSGAEDRDLESVIHATVGRGASGHDAAAGVTELPCATQRAQEEDVMPEKETIERAHEDAREGKSPSTQAGEFVREEMHHVREGKHGARSTKQAIAIGLSKARRAGVKLAAPKAGKASSRTRKQAARDLKKGQSGQ